MKNTNSIIVPHEAISFTKYLAECQALIEERRHFPPTQDIHTVINANMPFDLRPPVEGLHSSQTSKYGVLLIHGLLDCPFTLREIANYLHRHGILSRAILLPGHGTRPDDLLSVSYQDWIKTVHYGVSTLKKEVEQVFLIGYSTGAALSLYHALNDHTIAGVVLLAPAIKIKVSSDVLNMLYWIKKPFIHKEWIYRKKEIDYVRYRSLAFHPVQQVHALLELNQQLLQQQSLPCRTLMIMSDVDETVSSVAALTFFSKDQHAKSNFILYSAKNIKLNDDRIIVRPSRYADIHINNFSHVSLPFSKQNPHYGQVGDFLYASKSTENTVYGAYNILEKNIFDKLFQWGFKKNKKHILTYNPDFDFMVESILKFIQRS